MGELLSASTKESNNVGGDDKQREISPTCHVIVDIPAQVRQGKFQIYNPVLVSLGPYHHKPTRFKLTEPLKQEILDAVVAPNRRQKLLEEIGARLDDIRSFYRVGKVRFGDDYLAEMMLRDACFLSYCMKMKIAADHDKKCIVHTRLGLSRVAFVVRDFFMLENQLPFWIVKLLISSTPDVCGGAIFTEDNDHGNNGVEAFFYELLSSMVNCGDPNSGAQRRLPSVEQEIPHLLHARRATLVFQEEAEIKSRSDEPKRKRRKETAAKSLIIRSVKDLKAKGIHFRQSSTCLKDIRFSSHSFYGKLRLPILSLDNNTNVIFSNIIALEMSPGGDTDFAVISYVKLMKSLIEKAEDVKELREKGIILSCIANDEEVVKMFKEFNTDGSCGRDLFGDIRERINEHCSSKTKTFKAELIYTYFRSPWTAIALFAAILLLCINCLNFILNYYRMHRPLKRN